MLLELGVIGFYKRTCRLQSLSKTLVPQSPIELVPLSRKLTFYIHIEKRFRDVQQALFSVAEMSESDEASHLSNQKNAMLCFKNSFEVTEREER